MLNSGTASVARGYSGYLDSLLNNTMKNAFQASMPIHVPFLAEYPGTRAPRLLEKTTFFHRQFFRIRIRLFYV
jgi:hypothetical protein